MRAWTFTLPLLLLACTDKEPIDSESPVTDADADGVPAEEDCDDDDPLAYPGAEELCDDVDQDCDGSVDEGSLITVYDDADGDGYGDAATEAAACAAGEGQVTEAGDCDDTRAEVSPGAQETCDGVDEDCDDVVDEDASDASTWYTDADADGYGDDEQSTLACTAPSGTTGAGGDCDDTNADVWPGAPELLDGLDNDCDGQLSDLEQDPDGDGLAAHQEILWYLDYSSSLLQPDDTSVNGASTVAGQMADLGLTWTTALRGDTDLSEDTLAEYGTVLFLMFGGQGALTQDETDALEAWIDGGGAIIVVGGSASSLACDAFNSLPALWGFSCTQTGYWSGTGDTYVAHPLTDGVSTIGVAGANYWEAVASPAEDLVMYGSYPIVSAAEVGDGRVVVITDEWLFYNPERGGTSLGYGDHEQFLQNVWTWTVEGLGQGN
ncbi:MAG: putative metal-binding motif-containing protein [Alphaproteobacteria bacterium]|nr:putative metal-binding motif-containing protein [Alphaproteobacteria bacterium]